MIQEFTSYQKLPILHYSELDSKKIFIGCCIKSKYDEERIHINEDLNPKRLEHCGRYLYGAILEPYDKYEKLLQDLANLKSIDLYSYNKILMENNMSCDENFSYLEDGLYPIDSKHIRDLISDFKYEKFFVDDEESPIYQRIKAINLFLLKCVYTM